MKKPLLFASLAFLFQGAVAFADFTIGVNGDTQFLSQSTAGEANMKAMNQFYLDHKTEMNIKFVISVGDMTDSQNNSTEWSRVKAAYDILDAAGMPYAPCKGNHDNVSSINSTFPVTNISKKPYWGGSMNGGIENAYYLFSADGMDFILVVAQDPYTDAAYTWAWSIFNKFPARRGILACHNTNPGDGQSNQAKSVKTLFLTVMGHDCVNNGERNYSYTSTAGTLQHYCMTDYQCRSNDGAFVRLYTFKTSENKFCATTYNITEKAYERDANSEFCLDYPMKPVTPVQPVLSESAARDRAGSIFMSNGWVDFSSFGVVRALSVYDMSGKKCMQRTIGAGEKTAALGNMEMGRYIVRLSTPNGMISKPVVLVR